jgi:hypothetical protein
VAFFSTVSFSKKSSCSEVQIPDLPELDFLGAQ